MRSAQEMEAKLVEEEDVCNETMKALWEECKPCLKNTCVKYYSRTCSSGSGLVGRQVRPSPARTLILLSIYYTHGADISRSDLFKIRTIWKRSHPASRFFSVPEKRLNGYLSAAGGRAEPNVSLLHLDQWGKHQQPGAGRTAAEPRIQRPGGEIHRDGRRRGQHIFRQYEGAVKVPLRTRTDTIDSFTQEQMKQMNALTHRQSNTPYTHLFLCSRSLCCPS